jgi:hypothetical protein
MKCEICNNEAAYRFSPDLDIDGLGACETHKEFVQLAYYILLNEGEKAYNSFINSLKKSESQPKPPTT